MNQALISDENRIEHLVNQFASDNGPNRERARKELMKIGGPVVTRALVVELTDTRRDVRWEAAKALISIADPVAAPALVHRMRDEDSDIRWLAAEGLAHLGEPGLLELLSSCIRNAGDVEFCHAAHHALKYFKGHGYPGSTLAPVIAACTSSVHGTALPVAAYHAIQQIKPLIVS